MQTDIEKCGILLRGGSRTFYAASLVFPRRYREPASAVYAFCRMADDAIDVGDNSSAALDILRDRLDRIYRGCPIGNSADRAFTKVVEEFSIPRVLPESLLEGFAWDAENRQYETLDNLVDYAVRVAGTVGGMMTLLMGSRDPSVLARAIELGVAMQLTNIARDVGEDARAGRIYLPQRWLYEAGIDSRQFLASPAFSDALGGVIGRLLDSSHLLYTRAQAGIPHLPASCRPAIAAARVLYAEIGNQVMRNGLDSVSQRSVVSTQQKLACLAKVGAVAFAPAKNPFIKPLAQAQFLIDEVLAETSRKDFEAESGCLPWWKFGARAIQVIELFERLERREHLKRVNS